MIVNFDNAATTFPKPKQVIETVNKAVTEYGGNAGRGGHHLSSKTSEAVFTARRITAEFFGAKTENTIFTSSCTHSLNMAILGILKKGDHAVISSMEHNSVTRPITALTEKGIITCSVAKVEKSDEKTLENFKSAIKSNTKAVIMSAASNVTGRILPFKKVAEFCKKKNICFILDAAQAAGILPVKLENGISIICTAGHKGIYGISGTGILVTDAVHIIEPLMYGGTGSRSSQLIQPDFLPDRLESGTANIAGILSMKSGIEFLNKKGIANIHRHEKRMCDIFIEKLSKNSNIEIYRDENCNYVPIVAFNIKNIPSEETAERLDKYGFCLRAGLHCAPLAHKTINTENGAVRFSPSVFSKEKDVVLLCSKILDIAKENNNI